MEQLVRAFTSDPLQLAAMRAVVREQCRRAWNSAADAERIAQLELALDEAAANIMLHAYEGRTDGPIELTVATDADQACVTLCHEGQGFDPRSVPRPSFDGTRESGYGMYFMSRMADELAYFQDERGRQCVRLVKKRQSPFPPGSEGTG